MTIRFFIQGRGSGEFTFNTVFEAVVELQRRVEELWGDRQCVIGAPQENRFAWKRKSNGREVIEKKPRDIFEVS